MRKRIGFGISILIILIGSVFIVGRANGNDELPFSIEETKFGIKDDRIIGTEISINETDVEVLSSPLLDYNYGNSYFYEDLGFVFLKEKIDNDRSRFYLISANGCVEKFEESSSYKPEIDLLLSPHSGEAYDNGTYQYPYTLYSIYQPEIRKYNILNASTGEYLEYQLDDIVIMCDKDDEDVILFESNNLYGLIDKKGNIMHQADYNAINIYEGFSIGYSKNEGYVWLGNDGDCGEEWFSDIGDESLKMVSVQQDGGWGILNGETGVLSTECTHSDVLVPENGIFVISDKIYDEKTKNYYYRSWVVSKDGLWEVNDQLGGVYTEVESIADGKLKITLFGVEEENSFGTGYYRPVTFCGFVDVQGNIISDHTNDHEYDEGIGAGFNRKIRYYNDYLFQEERYHNSGDKYYYFLTTPQGEVVLDQIRDAVYTYGDKYLVAIRESGGLLFDCEEKKIIFEGISVRKSFYPDGVGMIIKKTNDSSKFGIYNTATGEFSDFKFTAGEDYTEYRDDGRILWEYENDNGEWLYINDHFQVVNQGHIDKRGDVDAQLNMIFDGQETISTGVYRYYKTILGVDGEKKGEFEYYQESLGNNAPYVTREQPQEGKYGLISSMGDEILPQEYEYIGMNWHGMSYAEGPSQYEQGVVDSKGNFLLQEKYSWKDFCLDKKSVLQSGTLILEDYNNSSKLYLYNFENIIAEEQDKEPLRITETYPEKGSDGVNLSLSSDIRITFNRNVNIFNDRPGDQLGSIQIKEYDTDKTVLEYNMLTGSELGQVIYLDGKRGKDTILLKNAMTVLDRGKKYYVLMDEYCVAEDGDTHAPVWFEGINDKETFSFKIGANTQASSDMTYLAACGLSKNSLSSYIGKTVEEFVNSDGFQDSAIWKSETSTYGSMYKEIIGGYTIQLYKEPTANATGLVVYVEPTTKKMIVTFTSVLDFFINESYIVNAYNEYTEIKKQFDGYEITLTGESGAGACASYISGVENIKTITFNAPIEKGLDLAFKNNISAITDYIGIENVPCKNYGTAPVLSFIGNSNYHDIEVIPNPHGTWGDINQLFERNENYFLTDIKNEKQADFTSKAVLSNSDYVSLIKTIASCIAKHNPVDGLLGIMTTGENLILGTQDKDYWRPGDLRTQIVYTGGNTSQEEEVFYGTGKGNFFNYSGGNAHIYGSSGQDLYFINSETGNLTISDYTDISFKVSQLNDLYSAITSFDIQNIKQGIKKVISITEILKAFEEGRDTVFINTGEVSRDNLIKYDTYYQLQVGGCTINIEKRGTPVQVIGLNDTELLLDEYGINNRSVAEEKINSDTKDYSVRGLLVCGENIAYDLYVNGEIAESGSTNNIDEIGKYHYTVTQKENEKYLINVSDEVEKLIITGGKIEEFSVTSLTDSTLNYVFDIRDNAGMVEIDYLNNKVLYMDNNEEITCVPEQDNMQLERYATGITLTLPQKVDYALGEELDISGLKVYKCYSDGGIKEITDYSVEGFDSQTLGIQEVSIIAGEYSSIFTVMVHGAEEVVTDITLPESMDIQVGENVLLDISITPQNINDSELIVQSSDDNIVKIRGTYIEGITEGTAEINVSDVYNRISKKCVVTVTHEKSEEPEEPVDEPLPFTDVTESDWYYNSVQYAYENGIMTGLNDTTFGPNESLARAQFAIILHRINETPAVDYTARFRDVGEGIWYTDAILWAADTGVVTGYSNGNFGPGDNINREQMAVMMYRYATYKGYDTSVKADFGQYQDAGWVSDFAQEALQWAVGEKIITGKYNETQLDPQGNASRAECATIMMRFMERYEK